jgi:hypothetical protein
MRSRSLSSPGTVASWRGVPTRSIPRTSAISSTLDFCHSLLGLGVTIVLFLYLGIRTFKGRVVS